MRRACSHSWRGGAKEGKRQSPETRLVCPRAEEVGRRYRTASKTLPFTADYQAKRRRGRHGSRVCVGVGSSLGCEVVLVVSGSEQSRERIAMSLFANKSEGLVCGGANMMSALASSLFAGLGAWGNAGVELEAFPARKPLTNLSLATLVSCAGVSLALEMGTIRGTSPYDEASYVTPAFAASWHLSVSAACYVLGLSLRTLDWVYRSAPGTPATGTKLVTSCANKGTSGARSTPLGCWYQDFCFLWLVVPCNLQSTSIQHLTQPRPPLFPEDSVSEAALSVGKPNREFELVASHQLSTTVSTEGRRLSSRTCFRKC
jgi:hypothetical protein